MNTTTKTSGKTFEKAFEEASQRPSDKAELHSAGPITAPSEPPVLVESMLVLTTQGRYSAKAELALLQYRRLENNFVVIAINNENRAKPGWFLNLKEEPIVQLKVGGAKFYAKAVTPTGRERLKLLPLMAEIAGSGLSKVPRDMTTVVFSPMC